MSNIPETLQAGLEHHRAGRLGQAEQAYRQVLAVHPRHAGAVHLLGLIAFQIGRYETAEQAILDAVKIDGFHAPFRADLGEVQRALGKIPEAIASYREALKLNPDVPQTHDHLGTLLVSAGREEEALACFEQALKLAPNYAPAQENVGLLRQTAGDLDGARVAFQAAVKMDPERAISYVRLGQCLRARGEILDAIACFQKAVRLDAELAEAHCARAEAWLSQGEFAAGWPEFEWRLHCAQPNRRVYDLPVWNGSNLHGKRLLVCGEGGASEILQFVRYLPALTEAGAEVWLDVPATLIPLLRDAGFANFVTQDGATPACDLQIPLLSLPLIFATTVQTIPAQTPYLRANDALVAQWQKKLGDRAGLKVGIAWKGAASRPFDRLRSIAVAEFQPLAAVPGVQLISLQREAGEALAAEAWTKQIMELGTDVDKVDGPFRDTAAIIANLDLIIACDGVTAHLAAALGARVWVALSTASDWRWLLERRDNPWYPTMRLFRQPRAGEWSEVFAQMAAELANLATKH